ncbi:MAG: hypothetical protein M3367_02490 [Acidobacteriota bacterium]|nr:hypothetical protein [Acidobacteriota bacterium]
MGLNGLNGFNEVTADNTRSRSVQTQTKIAPPPKGYTRIWIDVASSVGKDKDGKVMLSDADVERALFNPFALPTGTEADLQKLKTRLGTTENPFDYVTRKNANKINYRADGKYKIPLDVENPLYAKLAGKAAEIKQQIKNEQKSQTSANPNEATAVKNGTNTAQLQRAKLDKLLREAQVLPTSFGIPSKLTDTTHVVVTLPAGDAPTADNALSAYIERRFGGGNLWGPEKSDILNTAKLSGVKVENLKVSSNNSRVVEFDLNLESLLKLQKTYLDVQEKVNADVAVADKARDEMALNQFVLGVIQGAKDDIFGSINALIHPLETLQGVRDAVNILSQLTAEDVKNIAAELGNKASNATPGEAAYGAGYVVGTAVVKILLAKGTGAALSALGKTKAGAEFLARIGKLAEITNLGKAKIVEAFSDEAATVAKQKFFQRIKELGLSPNSITNIAADPELWARATQVAGNTIGKGYTKFADFSKQMVKELGEVVRPQLDRLYRDNIISLDLSKGTQVIASNGKVIDEAIVREAKEKVADFVKNNKPAELEKYLEEINEKYGSDLLKELKATREKFVDGIYDTTRRNVDIHDLLGGHIRDKHIGRSETWLRNRLKQPEMKNEKYASSFKSEETANRILGKFVKQHRIEIEKWLEKPSQTPLKIKFDSGESAGIVVERGKDGFKETNNVFVMLVKDNSANGWHFETAFPDMR